MRAAAPALASLAMLTGGTTLADEAAGERVFRQCEACHSIDDDGTGSPGPNLAGVVDRAAGALPGFTYSTAMAAAGREGLVWTPEALDLYLARPHGGAIEFAGVPDPADRAAVIDYLTKLGAGP
jgi:cytochrome c2